VAIPDRLDEFVCSNLSNLLSGYSVRLEEAMKELGERAAIVAEMVSSPDRRSIHPV